jgi:hypothetical protein
VVTACSDFQVRILQPIKLLNICISKQRLGRNLSRVFDVLGCFQGVEVGCDSDV